MSWRRKKTEVYVPRNIEEQQKEADDAVVLATVGYADALSLERLAHAIAKGHKRVQRENHLGEKMFGRPA